MASASHCYLMYCVWTVTQSGSYPEPVVSPAVHKLYFCAVVRRDWHLVLQDLERDLRVFYLTNVPLVCLVTARQLLAHTPDSRALMSRGCGILTVSTFVRLAVTSSLFIS